MPLIVEPEDDLLENGEEEQEFLNAIQKGDINTFMDLLNRKCEIYLNLECKDANGKSALRIAIAEGYSVIVDQLLMQDVHVGDALLRAVDVGYLETVKKICEYAMKLTALEDRQSILECHCEDDDFHPDITPIVLAAQRNDFSMIKSLLNAGTTIVNIASKNFTTKATDSLQKSVGTLEIYRGLASEAYITLANGDPVDRAFVMSHTLKKLSRTDVEFKSNYLELASTIDQVGTDIISHARTTEEIMTVLTHFEPGDSTADCRSHGPLPKLNRAIGFDQRKFVAHPNCQQVVRTMFYGRLAYLRDKSSLYRFIFFMGIVFSFPFMSLTCLYFPTKWVKSTIGCPYVKFMIQLASDLFFVFLLFADTISNRGEVGTFDPLQTPTKGIILLYVLGIGWREVKSVSKFGRCVFTQSRHLRDISLVTLFLSSFLFGIAQRYYDEAALAALAKEEIKSIEKRSILIPEIPTVSDSIPLSMSSMNSNYTVESSEIELEQNENISEILTLHRVANIPLSKAARAARPKPGGSTDRGSNRIWNITNQDHLNFILLEWWEPGILATSLFACSTVITFLRLFPYVVLSDITGPLQISVGSMVHGTVHFFWVVGVVTVAFAVGLTYIYAFFEDEAVDDKICQEINTQLDCRKGTLANVVYSIIYLYWSTFGLESMEPLKLPGQAIILEAAGRVLYAMFYVFVVVVLLNALIAVMSNVYNEVEENGDVEWKFASTAMWLGVLQDQEIVPPPFNLLPSTEDIRWLLNLLHTKCWYFLRKHVKRPDSSEYTPPKVQRNKKFKRSDRSQYRRVMSHLVERYVASKTAADVSVEADISIADIRALRNDLLALKFEMFQKFFDTVEDINRTIGDGYLIFKTSREANELFQRTEEIHSKVGTQLETVLEFQDTLSRKIREMQEREEPPPDTRSIGVQVNLFHIPAKVFYMDVSVQTSPGYWSRDTDCQTLTLEVDDIESQTDIYEYQEAGIQTDDAIVQDIYSQTDPARVQELAIQTVPLKLTEAWCQTCPPPVTRSYSQQTELCVRDLASQTDPPPPLPLVFECFTQITPPPTPPAVKHRWTQTAERRLSVAPQQMVPWRSFARATSPTTNSTVPPFNSRPTTNSSTSSLNSRRASNSSTSSVNSRPTSASSMSSLNSDSDSPSLAKSRFRAAARKKAGLVNKKR